MSDQGHDVIETSVIIPVYNDRNNLLKCLKSIFDTTVRSFEVIVVDDHSTESLEDVIKGFDCQYIRLGENHGPAYARNAGAKISRGDVLIFTDSDCFVPKDWVRNYRASLLARHQKDPKVSAVAGRLQAHRSIVSMSQMYSLYAYVINGPERSMNFLNTSCGAVLRSAFENVHGFSSDMRIGEDQDLALKLVENGAEIMYCPEIYIFHNHGIMTFKDMFKKNFTYGKNLGLKLYKNHPVHFRYWYMILSNPVLHFILIIPLAVITTFKAIKCNIFYDWKIIVYSPLVFINKILYRTGIFLGSLKKSSL